MTPKDIARLCGGAPSGTHLARYEQAQDKGVGHVRAVACPDCSAGAGADCTRVFR